MSMARGHDAIHKIGPQGWSMDRGSVVCMRPSQSDRTQITH